MDRRLSLVFRSRSGRTSLLVMIEDEGKLGKPDVVLTEKRTKDVKIIDIAIPGDKRVKNK